MDEDCDGGATDCVDELIAGLMVSPEVDARTTTVVVQELVDLCKASPPVVAHCADKLEGTFPTPARTH